MADMSPITVTINGTSRTFCLLEADIPILAFENMGGIIRDGGAPYAGYALLLASIGAKLSDYADSFAGKARSIFEPFVQDVGAFGSPRLVGKFVLARAANQLADTGLFYPLETAAVITMALRGALGAGSDIKSAGGLADALVRNSPSADGKLNYMQSVLAPQILRAAVAAAA